MAQNIELAQVKAKIRALIAKTTDNGASENEAMVAMKKVGELLNQFNLSMTDISEVRAESCIEAIYNSGSKHKGVEVGVSMGIAKICGVKVWMVRGNTGIDLHYFGLETDVEMAIYLTNLIANAYDAEYDLFKNSEMYVNFSGHRRVLQTNFLKGFSHRLYSRLIELASQTVRANVSNTGNALIVVEKSKYVEEEFGKMGMKLRTVKSYSRYTSNSGAYNAGSGAGGRVNLNRPVGGSKNFGGYLS